ncbi:MAG: carbohydrate ABC transporter permease [Clostridia bacterium]|nr:carbohydrate ABC transporter permease [Clostridia bacterium]
MYQKEKPVRRHKRIFRTKVNRSVGDNAFVFFLLTLLALFTALPLYLSIINSLKPLNELWIFPPRFYVMNPTFTNFRDLFSIMEDSTIPFVRYVFNTVFTTAVGTLGCVFIGSMCAYPMAKHRYPGSRLFFRLVWLSLMFSPAVMTIPTYLIVSKLNLIDSYASIILPAFGGTLSVYLMKQFIEQIPDAILEAARIDGASEYRIFFSVVMPSVKSAWLTVVLFTVQSLWTASGTTYIYTESKKPLSYALHQIITSGVARAGVAAAASVLMMSVPICVFIFTQSNVIETMASSGVKE